ncbi:hypothetical protein UVI_02021630 [Ustilaginoidea virens]|uniref:Uncharacterized protein n=1 Tax=Ustilaginoidea virens TaxID=1159556 RepID=A0A1B5L4Z7_USTVR|nr:hypothetical protein UVI_02021630 [Ustilaginoidea virens]
MAPSSQKANYRTYEAQARMVRAIVAAHPEVKWNYKDMTEHALNHRFRKTKAHAVIIKEGRALGFDMKNLSVDENELPTTKEAVDKNNIAKYFGQSTADGMQFQFRSIKKDAEHIRAVEASGGDVANCLPLSSSALNTPSKPKAPARATPTTGTARKRQRVEIKRSSSDEEALDTEDHSEKDDTPSKRPSKHPQIPNRDCTPSRRAASKASATIARLSARLERENTSDGDGAEENDRPYHSIFGDSDVKPVVCNGRIQSDGPAAYGHGHAPGVAALANTSPDPFMFAAYADSFYRPGETGDYGDGEI